MNVVNCVLCSVKARPSNFIALPTWVALSYNYKWSSQLFYYICIPRQYKQVFLFRTSENHFVSHTGFICLLADVGIKPSTLCSILQESILSLSYILDLFTTYLCHRDCSLVKGTNCSSTWPRTQIPTPTCISQLSVTARTDTLT